VSRQPDLPGTIFCGAEATANQLPFIYRFAIAFFTGDDGGRAALFPLKGIDKMFHIRFEELVYGLQ